MSVSPDTKEHPPGQGDRQGGQSPLAPPWAPPSAFRSGLVHAGARMGASETRARRHPRWPQGPESSPAAKLPAVSVEPSKMLSAPVQAACETWAASFTHTLETPRPESGASSGQRRGTARPQCRPGATPGPALVENKSKNTKAVLPPARPGPQDPVPRLAHSFP